MSLELIDLQKYIWMLLPLLALQLSLMVIGFWDWNKKKALLGQNKISWFLIILILSIIGPIIYLLYSNRLTVPSKEDSDNWRV